MVYEANVNKTLHYIKYCLLDLRGTLSKKPL